MNRPPRPTSADRDDTAWLRVGRIVRAHGLRGELKLKLDNPDSQSLHPGLQVRMGDASPPLELLSCRPASDLWIVRVQGVDDRDQADALRGATLSLPRQALPATDPDEYYHHELIGCTLHDAHGRSLGTIDAVDDHGAHAVLRVHDAHGRWLLPLVEAYVADIDVETRVLRVVNVDELIALTREQEKPA